MRTVAGALLAVTSLLLVSACSRNDSGGDSLLPSPPSTSPRPSRAAAPAPPVTRPPTSASPTRSPSPSGFSEASVVDCAGKPSASQVIAVVRRQQLIPSGAQASASLGPKCSGQWQYTVLTVTEHEPMQVVTKGPPTSLTFVTAGTDVCTVKVRAEAPVALLTAANCQ
jgi:hypothetical protein